MSPSLSHPWLSVVGIGEEGLFGLSPVARTLVDQAAVLVGGERHLAFIPADGRERLVWSSPLQPSIDAILQRRGQAVCVLASGDPLCYGIGVTLLQYLPLTEMTIIPAPSAVSLACARLGWSRTAVETLSLCGRPIAALQRYLYPGAQLLILSESHQTPAVVAAHLTQQGFGASMMTILEHLGGPQERLVVGNAATWSSLELADLNVIAVDCVADPGVRPLLQGPGLPDDAFRHDGQLTKQEVRAVTLATLSPLPGELLWDVGAGCGSIAIEWLRSHPRCRAIAIEPVRSPYIADNATALGVPHLQIVTGKAPAALVGLPEPDAIFIGGGVTAAGNLETCWNALKPGGRLVANVVTLEGEQQLFNWHQQIGGRFTRIAIQRAEPIGSFLGWKAMAVVTQWSSVKP
jgi:precorrin-6B C5,15-methyltransferase / cobalt-precorrin-6B C5,C15-methyltransferase